MFLLFLGTSILLVLEGRMALVLLCNDLLRDRERWLLGIPLAAFGNALLFFLFTVTHIPLVSVTILGAHALLLGGLGYFCHRRGMPEQESSDGFPSTQVAARGWRTLSWPRRVLIILLCLSLATKVGYVVAHAVLLPSFYYDSLSQWNMRAKISYEEGAIAFDTNEERGVSKSQYPILLHALQILFMLPQSEWHDRLANAATLLLSFGSFLGLFSLLARRSGFFPALITCAVLLMLPLLDLHLGQGYGDIHVIEYLLLSAFFLCSSLDAFDRTGNVTVESHRPSQFLLLSALFAASAAWVKQEGLFFGVLPWLGIVVVLAAWRPASRRELLRFGVLPLLTGFLWTVFLLARGMIVGAHAGDFHIAWHAEALWPAFQALFLFGSFSIFPYVLLILLPFVTLRAARGKLSLGTCALLLWSGVAFLLTLAVYVLTPNVEFLLNNQTFHRTMLLPLSLAILGVSLALAQAIEQPPSEEKGSLC